MNYTEIVREYIEGTEYNTPILLATIKNLVGDNAKMI
jgi:hypothetical protein